MDPRIQEMDDRLLLINLYLTQGITLILALVGLYYFEIPGGIFFNLKPTMLILGWSIGLAAAIIFIELLLVYYLPKRFLDDGGINEKLFSDRPIWHILIMVGVVAFSEELLFRAVIQTKIGLFYTSVLFSFIHIRYLKKWVMFTTVFIVSLALGFLFQYTESIIAPMICHFVIDFTLAVIIRFNWVKTKWEGKGV